MANAICTYAAKKAAALSNPIAATVFKQSDNSTLAAFVEATEQLSTEVKVLKVRAWGRATGGTTTNFTPAIQLGKSATAGSNTALTSATAAAFNTATGMWLVEATVVSDGVNGKLIGSGNAINGSTAALTALAAIASITVDPTVRGNISFCVTGLFSATNASNTCSLDGLTLEVL